MTEDPVYYQPPENHREHFRKMVIGLIIFFSALIVLVVLVFLNARWLATQLPFSAEKRFVAPYERFVRNVYDQEPSESDRAIEAYLQELVDELARDMDVPPEIEISVHYIDGPTVNAFATLGGHVFVFEGLLAAMPDENSLSMVLAHEAAHIKHRDPVAHLGRGFALGMLISFITGGEGGSGEIAGRGGELGLLYFSRDQESMADQAAIAALAAHYGHVTGYTTMFRALDEAHPDADSQPEWLSSHPDLDDRVRELEERVEARGWDTAEPRPIPEEVRQAIKN